MTDECEHAIALPVVYRAHWEDPLTRFFEQLFGPLEWNIIAIQDHYQCVWYSYFHPYPLWVSDSVVPIHHPWQTLVESHQLTYPITLSFRHHRPNFSNAITSYSSDPYSGGVQVVCDNLDCDTSTLLNFPYQAVTVAARSEASEEPSIPVELMTTIQNWMGKAGRAVVKLAAIDQQWYQQRLQLQPVDTRWWHLLVQQQEQLIQILRKGLSTGTIPCADLQGLVPFEVLPTTITLTTPSSIAVVHVPEPVMLQHHQELTKLIKIINDPRATTLLLAGILDSAQVLCDSTSKEYPPIPTFEGDRILRVQGDSPVLLDEAFQQSQATGTDQGTPSTTFPLILDSYTSDLSPYTSSQLTSLLKYINGLQDSDGSGDRKYILLQNRIVHTLAYRRNQSQHTISQGRTSQDLSASSSSST